MARELTKDAFLKVVLHDGVQCAAPGCDRTYHLQWDHKDPRANGGTTSIENMQPLCAPHHVEKTERDRRAGLLGPHARPPVDQFDEPP